MNAHRIEYRIQGNGWANVTVKTETGEKIDTFKVRSNADALVTVSDRVKAKGAQGVSWGACGSKYWVGFAF
ncbi:hypothetical protein ACIBKZ_15725 [Streptomyces sp. NPDC050421]|uniref:hypothetical protein n=1 Tax=Streptomyces sp. NPDC050421 TaxID=3365613 RepID=UPI0037A8B21E